MLQVGRTFLSGRGACMLRTRLWMGAVLLVLGIGMLVHRPVAGTLVSLSRFFSACACPAGLF